MFIFEDAGSAIDYLEYVTQYLEGMNIMYVYNLLPPVDTYLHQ